MRRVVRFLVASEADEASRRQREELLRVAPWTPEERFDGREAWRLRDLILVTIADLHLYRDHLERDLAASFDGPIDLVVYLSKHRSESGRPSLTVHPIGNPGPAEFGGQPGTLVPAAPAWMTAALRGLRREARGQGYDVTFEATHHGPYLTVPTFYIEQGSTEREWADEAAARTVALAVLGMAPVEDPVAIGLGGGHYVPRHTDLALTKRIAFGHLLPSYALETGAVDRIDQAAERTPNARVAYIHRKALPTPVLRKVEERIETLGLRSVREADLAPLPTAETS